MAKIQSSRAKIYETKATFADEPTEHVESEGERLIKQMVSKQLETQLNLQQQLNERKEFESATELVPITKFTSGQTTLKEFEDSAKKAAYIEELKSHRLTQEEIDLLLDYEKGEEEFSEKYKKMEKSALASRLLVLHAKIEEGRKHLESSTTESGLSRVGRHEKELGLCVKPNSEHTKLLQFALSCQSKSVDVHPPNHPINHLKEIEEELFGHMTKKQKRSKGNDLFNKNNKHAIDNLKPSGSHESQILPSTFIYGCDKKSLWDVKENSENSVYNTVTNQEDKSSLLRVYSCKPQTFYTIKNNTIVPLNKPGNVQPTNKNAETNNKCLGQTFVVSKVKSSTMKLLSLKDIEMNKISLDDIKSLPRFKDYYEGTPTKVLYVKNLAKSVTQDDLVSIFGQFENEVDHHIMYRLMNGRMKGQAFITFPNVETAKVALSSVNGFLLKGKPIIVQFGKSSS